MGIIPNNTPGDICSTIEQLEFVKILQRGPCRKFFLGQIVPGRMGLLVTLFLSLTALLVSTINSSPEVNLSSFAKTYKSKSFFLRLLKA